MLTARIGMPQLAIASVSANSNVGLAESRFHLKQDRSPIWPQQTEGYAISGSVDVQITLK